MVAWPPRPLHTGYVVFSFGPVSVCVKHAERCSEATFADGSCRFGLKVLGSARGPVHFERQAFDSEVRWVAFTCRRWADRTL